MSFPIETFYALEKVGKQKNSVFEFIPGLNLKSLKKQIFRVIEKPFWTRTRQDLKRQLVDLIILLSIRSAIEQETDIQLTKSKIRKTLSKDKLRHSNKEEITTDELNKIIDYFFEKYKEEKRNKSSRLIPSLRNYILVKLLAFTGQRIGDILSLEVNEAKKETLFFKQDKTGVEFRLHLFYQRKSSNHRRQ
jgi:integrase